MDGLRAYLGHGVGAGPVEPVHCAAHAELRHGVWLLLVVLCRVAVVKCSSWVVACESVTMAEEAEARSSECWLARGFGSLRAATFAIAETAAKQHHVVR